MKLRLRRYAQSQNGYTLIEVMIAAAIGAVLMGALVSVVLTTTRGTDVATSRVEASSEIRNFESFAYDDFAGSSVPSVGACGTLSVPCTTQPLVLNGTLASNSVPPVASSYQVSYAWDGLNFLDRTDGFTLAITHAATNVTAFSWYVDTSGAFPTVVVGLTVKVLNYSESQTFRFYPRMNP